MTLDFDIALTGVSAEDASAATVVVSGLPPGLRLSAGVVPAPGICTLAAGDLPGVRLTGAAVAGDGDPIALSVSATLMRDGRQVAGPRRSVLVAPSGRLVDPVYRGALQAADEAADLQTLPVMEWLAVGPDDRVEILGLAGDMAVVAGAAEVPAGEGRVVLSGATVDRLSIRPGRFGGLLTLRLLERADEARESEGDGGAGPEAGDRAGRAPARAGLAVLVDPRADAPAIRRLSAQEVAAGSEGLPETDAPATPADSEPDGAAEASVTKARWAPAADPAADPAARPGPGYSEEIGDPEPEVFVPPPPEPSTLDADPLASAGDTIPEQSAPDVPAGDMPEPEAPYSGDDPVAEEPAPGDDRVSAPAPEPRDLDEVQPGGPEAGDSVAGTDAGDPPEAEPAPPDMADPVAADDADADAPIADAPIADAASADAPTADAAAAEPVPEASAAEAPASSDPIEPPDPIGLLAPVGSLGPPDSPGPMPDLAPPVATEPAPRRRATVTLTPASDASPGLTRLAGRGWQSRLVAKARRRSAPEPPVPGPSNDLSTRRAAEVGAEFAAPTAGGRVDLPDAPPVSPPPRTPTSAPTPTPPSAQGRTMARVEATAMPADPPGRRLRAAGWQDAFALSRTPQPAVAAPEVAVPAVAEPEVAAPEGVGPVVAEPTVVAPEDARPEVSESEPAERPIGPDLAPGFDDGLEPDLVPDPDLSVASDLAPGPELTPGRTTPPDLTPTLVEPASADAAVSRRRGRDLAPAPVTLGFADGTTVILADLDGFD